MVVQPFLPMSRRAALFSYLPFLAPLAGCAFPGGGCRCWSTPFFRLAIVAACSPLALLVLRWCWVLAVGVGPPFLVLGCAVLMSCRPLWLRVLCWCFARHARWACYAGAWPAAMVGRAVQVRGPPPWLGVLNSCVPRCDGTVWRAGVGPTFVVVCVVRVLGRP